MPVTPSRLLADDQITDGVPAGKQDAHVDDRRSGRRAAQAVIIAGGKLGARCAAPARRRDDCGVEFGIRAAGGRGLSCAVLGEGGRMGGGEDARPEMQQHDDAEHGQAHRGENASALCQPPHRYNHAGKSILRSVATRYGG